MKKSVEATPAPAAPSVGGEPEIYIVGLKKFGPGKYCVVTGTTAKPILDVSEKDKEIVTNPLEYASEGLKLAVHKLLLTIP